MRRKLIRSRGLVDKLGHYTGKFNWTEVFTVFGVVVRCFQLKNLGYSEIMEIYPRYFPPGEYREINHTYGWFEAVTYSKNKKPIIPQPTPSTLYQ